MSQSPETEAKPNSFAPSSPKKKQANRSSRNRSGISKPRIISDGHRLDRSDAARKRYKITAEMMEGVPHVTQKIVSGAGSIQIAIEALRADDSSDSLEFIRTYDSILPSDRTRLRLEEIFTLAGLSARRFIELVTGALMQQSGDVSRMLTAVSQPKVIAATVKAATESLPIRNSEGDVIGYTNGDVKAQEMFHRATGWLPIPKGAQTVINMQQLNQGTKEVNSDDDSEELESMDSFLMGMQDVLRPQLPAPAPVQSIIPVNAPEFEYVDAEI